MVFLVQNMHTSESSRYTLHGSLGFGSSSYSLGFLVYYRIIGPRPTNLFTLAGRAPQRDCSCTQPRIQHSLGGGGGGGGGGGEGGGGPPRPHSNLHNS